MCYIDVPACSLGPDGCMGKSASTPGPASLPKRGFQSVGERAKARRRTDVRGRRHHVTQTMRGGVYMGCSVMAKRLVRRMRQRRTHDLLCAVAGLRLEGARQFVYLRV